MKVFGLKIIFISVIVVISTFILSHFKLLDRFELTTLDYRFKLRPQKKGSPQIAIVEIAEDSIQQIGRWPWSRDWHAELIDILTLYKAKIIDIDILFSEKSEEPIDNFLASAIKRANNVYLPFVFERSRGEIRRIESLPVFYANIKGTGYINVLPDEDGVIRRIEFFKEYQGKTYYHIGFKIACDYLGVKEEDIQIYPKRFIELKNTSIGNIKIPLDEQNRTILNWPGKWEKTFKHFSFVDIIVSHQQVKEGMKPRINLQEFKDKICLVGLTAVGLIDIKPIPLETLYPALGVHACIIDNILRKDFIRDLGRFYKNLAIIFCSLLVGMIFLLIKKPIKFALLTLALATGYCLLVVFLFNTKGLWLNLIYPLFSLTLAYTSMTLYSQIVSALEKARLYKLAITDSLTGVYVRGHFNLLLDAKIQEARRSQQRLSIAMLDIDHFKSFNDTYGHQTGDFILKEVAAICKSATRGWDVLARYGGEEFVLMLPNTDLKGAKMLAERIRALIEKHVFIDNNNMSYRVNISLGVADLEEQDTRETLVNKADAALYLAKRTGRNKVCDWQECQEDKKENP
ncbi:MAG: CHASE2 domain-containing protein [Candidatus Omnitrophica bacterium]|nr:CHASE2 domain-containing protein [Candidatus Omnitrophota bacterium]